MNDYLKRFFLITAVVVVYFVIWKDVRSAFTKYIIIPQIEIAAERCDDSLDYKISSRTAVVIYHDMGEPGSKDGYRFNAPAGFYLLFGVIFLVLLNGDRRFYQLILGYHLIFTIVTVLTTYAGLCYAPFLLHISAIGNSYFTPFFTFFVLILLVYPSAHSAFQSEIDRKQE